MSRELLALAIAGAVCVASCGTATDAPAPAAPEAERAAPPPPEVEPEPEPEPEIREIRYVDHPWPEWFDGFPMRTRLSEESFRARCERRHGRFGHDGAIAGTLACSFGDPRRGERTVVLEPPLEARPGVCSWGITERMPIAQATDARIGERFREMEAIDAALRERGTHGRSRRPRRDRLLVEPDDECLERLRAGDFECVRTGEAMLHLETSTGTIRVRMQPGDPPREEVLEDTTESITMDAWRDAGGGEHVSLRRETIVRCSPEAPAP